MAISPESYVVEREFAESMVDPFEAIIELRARVTDLEATLAKSSERWDGPETDNFIEGVRKEAAHQIARWGAGHDDGKGPEEFFWVVGYLAGKALASFRSGDIEKAKHHAISTSAVMLNWHARIRSMEPDQRGEGGADGAEGPRGSPKA